MSLQHDQHALSLSDPQTVRLTLPHFIGSLLEDELAPVVIELPNQTGASTKSVWRREFGRLQVPSHNYYYG